MWEEASCRRQVDRDQERSKTWIIGREKSPGDEVYHRKESTRYLIGVGCGRCGLFDEQPHMALHNGQDVLSIIRGKWMRMYVPLSETGRGPSVVDSVTISSEASSEFLHEPVPYIFVELLYVGGTLLEELAHQ
jgi:hypothetical protein